MRTVGQILKETREDQFYSLEEVEKSTKIRKELLQALEADDYKKLPPTTFVQGFIKNYAKFLKIESGPLLAIFRRELPENKRKAYVMDAFANPVQSSRFKLTPGRVLGGVISLIILSFFVYLWFQYRQLVGFPQLAISSPVDQLSTDNAVIIVEGKTDPESKIMVNNQEVKVDLDGAFKEEVTLSSQVNKLSIIAISRFGQKVETDRTVYLKR